MKLSALSAAIWVVSAAAALAAEPARNADPPAFALIDVDRGIVLTDHEADTLWYPASLSKLMTAYVTFEALKAGRLKMTSPVTVSEHALDQPPSKMGFKVGTVMTVDNALKMLLVKSANDIAVAIAESVGGKESTFVAAMNATAARLGMVSTRYVNPHGLPDPGQLTTARDMAVLADAIWTDFPEYRSYLGITAIKSGKTVLTSGNRLLDHYVGTNGMKTGFICSSGYNLIVSATRDDHTLIAVVMGGNSWTDVSERAAGLLDRGFDPVFLELSAGKPELASFAVQPVRGAAVDMRDYGICKPGKDDTDEDEGAQSLLGPRFYVMDPVIVTTGGADPKAPVAKAAVAPTAPVMPARVPLPRLRPR